MAQRALARGLLQAPPADDEALTFTASTTRLNRYGFRLRHEGWRIQNYNLNPVVLWMHVPFMRPIGRGRASLQDGRLLNTITFDRDNPFAADIERQYRSGFLSAVSVGIDFVDEKGAPLTGRPTAEQIEKEAYYDLAEVSAVPVPADPGALKMNRATLAAAYGTLGLELLDEFGDLADWGAVVGETPPPQQVADWLARNDLPTLPPGSGAAPPAAGMSEDRLAAVEATVGRLMDLLETSLTRALQVPRIASALEEVELDLSSLTLTVIPSHNTAVEDSPWDAAAAVAAMPNEAAVLRYCHASYDADGDPDAKGTYHFPHHRTQGGPANLGACRNGKARVGPSGVPDADKPGIERHLQNHLDAQPSNEGWAPDHVQDFLAGIRL